MDFAALWVILIIVCVVGGTMFYVYKTEDRWEHPAPNYDPAAEGDYNPEFTYDSEKGGEMLGSPRWELLMVTKDFGSASYGCTWTLIDHTARWQNIQGSTNAVTIERAENRAIAEARSTIRGFKIREKPAHERTVTFDE